MPLPSQTEGFETLKKQERPEWIQTCPQIAKDFHSQLYDKRQRSERLAESEAMESFGRLRKRRELSPCEIKLPCKDDQMFSTRGGRTGQTRTDNHPSDGGAVAADPLCSTVD